MEKKVGWRIFRWVVLGFVVVALVLIADAIYVGVKVLPTLGRATTSLVSGADRLQAGEPAAAKREFDNAIHEIDQTKGLLEHPVFRFARMLPIIHRDADAASILIDVAGHIARAGVIGTQAATRLGIGDGGSASPLLNHGRVDFVAVDDVSALVTSATRELEVSAHLLGLAPDPRLTLIDAALEEGSTQVHRAIDSADDARSLLSLLPGLLAKDSHKRYFLAFQTLDEARGTGGLIGMYGILDASDGRLRLASVAPIRALIPLGGSATTPDPWFKKRYGSYSALREWQEANMSPDMPAVSRVLLDMYAQKTGERLDGVFSMDAVTLKYLTRATGPIRGSEPGLVVAPETAETVLLRDIYDFGQTRQELFLLSVIRGFWEDFQTGSFDSVAMGRALGDAVASRHLQIYSVDVDDQEVLDDLEASGSIASVGSTAQIVFHNNFGANKIDYYLKRSIDMDIELRDDGDVSVTTTVELDNQAPVGVESRLTGDGALGTPPGVNGMVLSVILPEGARVDRKATKGLFFRSGVEATHPVMDFSLNIPPGKTRSVTVAYLIEGGLVGQNGERRFDLTLAPQARTSPDRYSISVTVPDGYSLITPQEGLEGVLERTETIRLVIEAS